MTFILKEKTEKRWDYSRLNNRRNEVLDLSFKTRNDHYLMEMDCIDHLFECEGLQTYEKIALFCEEHNIRRVVDIGCAYAHQSEVFAQANIDYLGVNNSNYKFWNRDIFAYEVGTYPCQLPIREGDLGISVLCLTWNCYLKEGRKTLIEQVEGLSKDFEHCILYMQPDHLSVMAKYFKKIEKLDERNLFYFSNK